MNCVILISTKGSEYVRSTAPKSFFGSFSKRTESENSIEYNIADGRTLFTKLGGDCKSEPSIRC